ncbi:hypothetical protein MTO96_037969, partial [Rhipicephalus appendiculatus]
PLRPPGGGGGRCPEGTLRAPWPPAAQVIRSRVGPVHMGPPASASLAVAGALGPFQMPRFALPSSREPREST